MKYLEKAGIYIANVESPMNGWFVKSSKGTPGIQLRLIVAEGEEAGRSIDYYAWLSDNSVDNSIRTLVAAFGWDGDLLALQNGADPFGGKDVEITVENEVYKDKLRSKVKWLNAIGRNSGRSSSSIDSREVESLVQKLARRAKAIASEANSGAAQQAASAPAAARAPRVVKASDPIEYQDDDIPF